MPETPLSRIISALEAQKRELEHEFKVELPKQIGIARAHGDLSENAEYHAARERHAFVNARIGQIDGQLARLKSIDLKLIPRDRVGLYSRVKLFDIDSEEEIEWRLVTSEEADFDKGQLSVSSPIGQALVSKKEGDEVKVQVPSGARHFEIVSVSTIHDQPGAAE